MIYNTKLKVSRSLITQITTDFRGYFLDRALVFICHGYGEHCSRYERLGNALAEQGYLAFSQITVCPTPPLFNLFRDTVTAFNHTFSRGKRGGGGV